MEQKEEKLQAEAPESPDARPETAEPTSDIEELRQRLRAAEEESKGNYDKFLRERADLENFKRRMRREKDEAVRFAAEPLVRDLLPVVDNLERAVEHANSAPDSLIEGVKMILGSIEEVLQRHAVKRVDAVGQPFDPTVHEAIAQVPSAEHDENVVVEQHQSGYSMHERLLRPALVVVASAKAKGAVESGPDSD